MSDPMRYYKITGVSLAGDYPLIEGVDNNGCYSSSYFGVRDICDMIQRDNSGESILLYKNFVGYWLDDNPHFIKLMKSFVDVIEQDIQRHTRYPITILEENLLYSSEYIQNMYTKRMKRIMKEFRKRL